MDETLSTSPKLALPAPVASDVDNPRKISIDQSIKLDELGPMVVNSDGTLSRIENWRNMTKEEQERTMRVLGARNRLRIANEEKKQLQDLAHNEEYRASNSSQ